MFVTQEEFDNLDWFTLNSLLERVHNKAVENTLKLLPEIITGLMVKSLAMSQIFEKFRTDHPEIAGREEEIKTLIQEIEFSDGTLPLPEILKRVSEKLKERNLAIPINQPHTVAEIDKLANGLL